MMKTPICDFVKAYDESEKVRLHMPGHKGKDLFLGEKFDITEIDGADVLYSPTGIIKESQKNACSLFGSGKTLYSTEGSSLAIRAMVYLTKLVAGQSGKKAKILALRNAHKTFITAAALLDVDVQWLYGEESEGITCCNISKESVEKELSLLTEKATALYVTSPDYLGNIADIKALSSLCREKGILLLVDNAHGAYLKFLPENIHPLSLGAHMCCDSAHKTLPVLTGGAYLHISKNAPEILSKKAENALSLFASTSPSYLILQSLDKVNEYLSSSYGERLSVFAKKAAALKMRLEKHGYTFIGDEPLKLTLKAKEYGYTGIQIGEYLKKNGIVCEFSDPDYTVMMLTPENEDRELALLEEVLINLTKKDKLRENPPAPARPEKVLSPSQAIFSATKTVKTQDSLGCILGSVSVSCPPAVPVVISGERIGKDEIALFEYYGIEECEVII